MPQIRSLLHRYRRPLKDMSDEKRLLWQAVAHSLTQRFIHLLNIHSLSISQSHSCPSRIPSQWIEQGVVRSVPRWILPDSQVPSPIYSHFYTGFSSLQPWQLQIVQSLWSPWGELSMCFSMSVSLRWMSAGPTWSCWLDRVLFFNTCWYWVCNTIDFMWKQDLLVFYLSPPYPRVIGARVNYWDRHIAIPWEGKYI